MTHELWVVLHRKVMRSYSSRLRGRVWRELTAHPAIAYRLALKTVRAQTAGACTTTLVTAQIDSRHRHPSTGGTGGTGASGASVSPGATGATGATGSPGTIGATGSTGSPGTTGDPGAGSAPAPLGVAGSWGLKFDDEFSGTSLNGNQWTPGWFGTGVTNPVDSSEIEANDSSQVSVSGGNLHLTAVAKTDTAPNGTTYSYASGLVSSNGKFQFTYGVMEARMYLPPTTSGTVANWPAFWADGTGQWPATGELDVMEGLSGRAAYHFHSPSGGPGKDVSGAWTGWHTFAANWQPGVVTYYYDGTDVGSITTGITSSPMYVIVNNAIQNSETPVVPADVQVDYVRVWQ